MAPRFTERPQMEGYGVPEDLDGVLSWDWALARLEPNQRYWVATADASGRPHALPVWGVWDGAGDTFWLSCAPSARKADNLTANPRVVVTTEDAREVVSVEGVARRVPADEIDDAVAAYLDKYDAEMPGTRAENEAFLREGVWFAVTPERAFGLIETPEEFARAATRWRW